MIERGAICIAAERGVLTSKPRPILIVQTSRAASHTTVTACLITTSLVDHATQVRIPILPTSENGLSDPSEIMIDRLFTFQRASIVKRAGTAEAGLMQRVNAALRRWLDL